MSAIEWIVLAIAMLLSIAVLSWRWQVEHPSKAAALAVTALYGFTLLLALRAGARTYPGIWHPESELLNGIFNGNWLFVGLGYQAASIAGAASALLIFLAPSGPTRTFFRVLKWGSTGVAFVVIGYGVYWAALAERLPWMADAFQ